MVEYRDDSGGRTVAENSVKIAFQPLDNIAARTTEQLRDRVGSIFRCPIVISLGDVDLAQAYQPQRDQYLSSRLLSSLSKHEADERVVGLTEVDLYVPRLNYVFGEADPLSGRAIVSFCRLRQEYYGLPPDETLFLERAVKEIVHELGHTFGLEHCPNSRCVMYFSSSLADTDLKETGFCGRCQPRIIF
jgi:archaemetzincin